MECAGVFAHSPPLASAGVCVCVRSNDLGAIEQQHLQLAELRLASQDFAAPNMKVEPGLIEAAAGLVRSSAAP